MTSQTFAEKVESDALEWGVSVNNRGQTNAAPFHPITPAGLGLKKLEPATGML